MHHLHHGEAFFVGQVHAPGLLKLLVNGCILHGLIPWVHIGQGPQVTGALHVVLAAQGIDA